MSNWKDSQQEDMQTIEIHLTRGVVIALGLILLFVAALGYLVGSQRDVAASGVESISLQSSAPAKFYLTSYTSPANQVLTACRSGYHTASLWEIIDPSNLEYISAYGGETTPDAGSGPPSCYWGWVRTGYMSSVASTPGTGNCQVWTSTDSGDYGTHVRLPYNWTGTAKWPAPWEAEAVTCNDTMTRVWCVED